MLAYARPHVIFIFLVCLVLFASSVVGQQSFVLFETGQVRPLALSPDGKRLYAVNTPDNRLEVFEVTPTTLIPIASIPVGMEPTAVAVHSHNKEVWVVNHLSDSVTVVDVSRLPMRAVQTLLVGDEPQDIVFAGPGGERAFISTAHRGQNSPFPRSDYTQAGIGRADIWVYDASNPGSSLGGDPLTVLTLFGDKPRALAVSPDGQFVYAAIFHSGNRTTTVPEGIVCDGGATAVPCTIAGVTYPGGLPAPNENHEGIRGPEVGLIVKFNGMHWLDELGRDWSAAVRFSLPDLDVFTIDATALDVVASFAGVGTILFNMIVNPVTGAVYVTNTDARNEVRFEGPGRHANGKKPSGQPNTVRGHLHEARITILGNSIVAPRHLNKHIPYEVSPVPSEIKAKSLATPMGMAVSSDGRTLYVAAFGSSKIGIFDTTSLVDDSFVPNEAHHIRVEGGGPSGLTLDEPNNRLYVLTRFNNAVVSIDLETRAEMGRVPLYNPEPTSVVQGRPFLYDATLTSSNGESSCASCHIFGDLDDLAWDLGNPDDDVVENPNPFPLIGDGEDFHPLKGPMLTQSLHGLAHHGPMHWRGDRTGSNANPPVDFADEQAAFLAFNEAFDNLLGRDEGPLSDTQMQAFTDFILQLTYPPNPIRLLDNTLRPDEANGHIEFTAIPGGDEIASCQECHALAPGKGHFGTDGSSSSQGETQEFKVPHLRNAYQKVGRFGMPEDPFINSTDHEHQGDQIRGYGYLHDGSIDTLKRFLQATAFISFILFPDLFSTDVQADLEAFILAFDTTFAPIVGQQVTLTMTSDAAVLERIRLLETRSDTPFELVGHPNATECDLVVKGVVGSEARGWVRTNQGTYRSDRSSEPELSGTELQILAAVPGQALTYTCTPPGSGVRMGIDRDEDGALDRDELDAGKNPADAVSRP